MKIIVTTPDDKTHELDAVEGWSIMEIIRDHGLPIRAECGGACCCAKCHVYIDPAWWDKLAGIGLDEEDMLDQAPDVEDNSRLSCQIIMNEELSGLRMKIAPAG